MIPHMLWKSCLVLTIALAALVSVSAAEEIADPTPADELCSLVHELQEAFNAHYTAADEIEDPVERRVFYSDESPAHTFLPRLLEFEERHRGTDLGLMALRQVKHLQAGGGAYGIPTISGKRELMARLPIYCDRPLAAEILRYMDTGHFDMDVDPFLQRVSQQQSAHPVVREMAKFVRARFMLSVRIGREFRLDRIADLEAGAEPRHPDEAVLLKSQLPQYPDESSVAELCARAVGILEELAAQTHDLRQPAVKNVDKDWIIIEFDPEETQQRPRISDLAAGLLFQNTHLRLGQPAPELTLQLVNGDDWTLRDQLGKVVIVQFSFKGCGPCEAMYPTLREIAEAHQDRISILSVMADEDRQDTVEAVEQGKMTWNVTWDGFRGPVATLWGVSGFPTVHVFDQAGKVADVRGLRGEHLRRAIDELIAK